MEYNVNNDDNYSPIRFTRGKGGWSIMSIVIIIIAQYGLQGEGGGGVGSIMSIVMIIIA